jgi:hypothetical protein
MARIRDSALCRIAWSFLENVLSATPRYAVSYFACGVIETACTLTVHAVSLTPHAFYIFFAVFIWFSLFEVVRKFLLCMRCQWYSMHHACGVNDTTCIVHAVSMIPHTHVHAISMTKHVPCMWYQWHRMHRACGVNDTACKLKNSNIFANSNLYSKRLSPINQEPRTDVLMKKTEGQKSRDTVPLKGQYHEIFDSWFFCISQSHICPWLTG